MASYIMAEHRLRASEKRVLRKMPREKKYVLKESWRKLPKEELYNFYSSPDITRVSNHSG